MTAATLTFATGDYDRTRPLIDGTIKVEGFDLAPVVLPPRELFPRAFREGAFEISELSASTHAIQVARGESRYVGLPVFLSRSFRLNSIYVRSDRGIEEPRDLEGRLVGLPEYQMTLAVWLRGMLKDAYGVDVERLRYRTGGIDTAGRTERIALRLPPGIDCEPIGPERTLSAMLADGELDAVLSPRPPACFRDGHPHVRRLFDAPAEEEANFFRSTGMFPIMHILGIRLDVVERHPELPARLFAAMAAARDHAVAQLERMAAAPALPLMLPWLADHLDHTRRVMGRGFWPYGIDENRKELEALCRYLHEQHLVPRPVQPEDLFLKI